MNLASTIDHTILKPDAAEQDILRLCAEAAEYGFASVCVNPIFVPLAHEQLSGKSPVVCTVAGFPLGALSTEAKAKDAEISIRNGAAEVDMVISVGLLKQGAKDRVLEDIQTLADLCHQKEALLKVIIETCLLSSDEKKLACELVCKANADFVKTSTGFAGGGATVDDVRLLKSCVQGSGVKVKASGGIRSREDALSMIEAGADRIGTSSGVKIVTGG